MGGLLWAGSCARSVGLARFWDGRIFAKNAGTIQWAGLADGHGHGRRLTQRSALALESMTQAVRHVAFVIPAGLGVQEAGLVIFGHALGISSELAIAVSMAKRIREVLCGLPSLISWQWLEGRRLQA